MPANVTEIRSDLRNELRRRVTDTSEPSAGYWHRRFEAERRRVIVFGVLLTAAVIRIFMQ